MRVFPHDLVPRTARPLGLIVLQSDERIEPDMRRLLPADLVLHVSRVPSAAEVTRETLAEMEGHLTDSAALLPPSARFQAIGYGCTSGTAQIGPDNVARRVQAGAETQHVSEPVSALLAACRVMGISRLALLSPYVESVSDQLRRVLARGDVDTPVFATFDVAQEARVIRISTDSTIAAAAALAESGAAAEDAAAEGGPDRIDGIFLSCTNLDTLDAIAPLESRTGLPVLSSNLVLAWHMAALAGRQLTFSSRLVGATSDGIGGQT